MAICKKCGAEVVEGAMFCTECGESLVQPFEVSSKPSSNPFAEMEENVPIPEVSSTLIFDDPIQEYKEEQAQNDWSNQSNYGKPQFDPNAADAASLGEETPGFEQPANNAGYQQAGGTQANPFGAFTAGMAGETIPPHPNNNWEQSNGQQYAYQQGQYYGGQQYGTAPMAKTDKSKVAAGVLAILIGALGIHKFYLGYTNTGLIMLLATILTCGFAGAVMGVIGIVEGIIYLTMSDEDFYRTYVAGEKKWF